MMRYVGGVAIPRIACALPRQKLSLVEYAPNLFDEKSAKRMAKGTGFSRLRIAPADMTTADLCVAAAERILGGSDRSAVGSLVFVTQTPDYTVPATSHAIQERLRFGNDVLCLDINEGCSGWVTGLYTASLLCHNTKRPVCLLGGDTPSKTNAPDDRATMSIFGDAGTATLLEPGGELLPFLFKSYGDRPEAILLANYYQYRQESSKAGGGSLFTSLDGGAIMDFSLDEVPSAIEEFLEEEHLSKEDVSLYACHQANQLILKHLADKIGVPREKMPFTSGEIGNESSASIPLVLQAETGKADLSRVLCCGFGVGLSIGICLADFSKTEFFGVEEI